MRKTGILLILTVLLAFAMTSCLGGKDTDDSDLTVSVSTGEHFRVTGNTSATVKKGGNATFMITVDEGYFIECSDGEYDEETGILTVSNVQQNTTVTVTAKLLSEASYTVSIAENDAITVTAPSSVTVSNGGEATFAIQPKDSNQRIAAVSAGTYDEATGILTVSGVRADTEIIVTVGSMEKFYFESFGAEASGNSGIYYDGTVIRLKSIADYGYFVGWSIGSSYANGGVIVSNETEYQLTLREKTLIYANYVDNKNYTFRVVDGTSTTEAGSYAPGTSIKVEASDNKGTFLYWTLGSKDGKVVSDKKSYSFILTEDTVLVANYESVVAISYNTNGGTSTAGATYTQSVDTSFYTSPNALYDNGTFSRPGYVLIEYNTKADGTGTGYSLGSKIDITGAETQLYCIWEKATAESLFTTTNVAVSVDGDEYTGLTITGYTGTDATLVIPETIGGRQVVQISAGAISDKSFTKLVLSKNLRKIADGAFTGCSALETLYMSDGIYHISDKCFDAATYTNWQHFRLNATIAPRYCSSTDGGYRVKWDRLMAGSDGDMIVYVSGSSSLHGIATDYLEALFDDEYTVVNYGTVRTTNNLIYMEAVANFVNEGDIVIYAPENSIWQYGYPGINYKTYRDLEGSLNVFRYVDMRHYTSVFEGFADYQERRWGMTERSYAVHDSAHDSNGDYQSAAHTQLNSPTYVGNYSITFDNRVKPINENLNKPNDDSLWMAIGEYADHVKAVMSTVRATGAKVYFGFCSVNYNALTETAKTAAQQAAYDKLITDTFDLEVLGSCTNHIFEGQYTLTRDTSDFHLNDYGRPLNTYASYKEICQKLGITPKAYKAVGTGFAGCIFQ